MSTPSQLLLNVPPTKLESDVLPPRETTAQRAEGTDNLPKGWLGIATNHRRLLDASQDGWLRPADCTDLLLGYECFIGDAEVPAKANVIPVLLAFDPRRLPFPNSRKEERIVEVRDGMERPPKMIRCAAPLSLHAVVKVQVPCIENRDRLVAMAGQLANVPLPGTGIDVGAPPVIPTPTRPLETSDQPVFDLPDSLDAVQGAMATATWAVPRIDPWIDLLTAALRGDAAGVEGGARALRASWLDLPWLVGNRRDDPVDAQAALWRAAVSVMCSPTAQGNSPSQLAEKIAQTASRSSAMTMADAWARQTQRLVAAEEPLSCMNWRERGAGLAIQLALLRPEPMSFKAWSKDLPNLPPAVWWGAAALCGWRHGYRALDVRFRGDANLQKFHAIQALAASWKGDVSAVIPDDLLSHVLRRKEDGDCFSLTWGSTTVFRKPWHPRARWFNADLTDAATAKSARDLASRLKWPCLRAAPPVDGNGSLFVEGMELPVDLSAAEWLDHDEFRRQLAVEAGEVPDPPRPPGKLHGFAYLPNFITAEEEDELLQHIDDAEWSTELKRRVQHYGWRYDYGQRQIDESMRLGELPFWADKIAKRLVAKGLVAELPDQVIVNEYRGNQGISRHVDQPESFAEPVATVSLLESWGMVFRRRGGKEKVERTLERRSVAVLAGDARYKWTHEIPSRKTERVGGKRIPRERRISLTFRKVRFRRTSG